MIVSAKVNISIGTSSHESWFIILLLINKPRVCDGLPGLL